MEIKEYYFKLINELNKYTLYSGFTGYLDDRAIEGFQLKNSEYLTDWEPNAMFLFSFTVTESAPDDTIRALLDIYAHKFIGMADLFEVNDENIAQKVKLHEMIGELQ